MESLGKYGEFGQNQINFDLRNCPEKHNLKFKILIFFTPFAAKRL